MACDLPNARHCQLRKRQEQSSQGSKLEAEVFLSSELICGVLLHLEIKLIYCVFLLEFLSSFLPTISFKVITGFVHTEQGRSRHYCRKHRIKISFLNFF